MGEGIASGRGDSMQVGDGIASGRRDSKWETG